VYVLLSLKKAGSKGAARNSLTTGIEMVLGFGVVIGCMFGPEMILHLEKFVKASDSYTIRAY
jgi:hypothetical protein